jgi:ABC-type multidrug transport system fused ATPase/permease subunit
MPQTVQRLAASVPALVRRFSPYLRPVRGRVALAAAILLSGPLTGAALLWLIKLLVDDVLIAGRLELLPLFGGIYVLAAAAKVALDYVGTRLDASVSERIVRDIRVDLYRHVVSLSPGSLQDRGTGDRLAHLSGDVERTQSLIYTAPLSLCADIATAAFFGAFLLFLDWQLTLVALLVVPFLAVASFRYAPRLRRAARITRGLTSRWFDLAEERLGAAPLIHAFGSEERETARFAARCDAARRAELRTVTIQAWLTLLIEAATALGGVIVLAVGAYAIKQGALTVGTLVAFLGAVGSLYSPVRGLARAAGRFQRAAAGAQRVADLLDTPSLVRERRPAKRLAGIRGAVEFRSLCFSYPQGDPVLRDVSCRIEPGEMVAIAGASGSGKSTLAKLLLRFYDPTAGAVLIDGTDIRGVTLDSLRRAVSVVFQDPLIVQGSIADNLRYGQPQASDASLLAAAQAAHVHPFVSALGAGYRAAAGTRGGRLSGGQRQRLALARSLLRDSPILVLDEATAAVDSETEELVHGAIEDLAGDRTIVIVGHRLSSLRRADRVLVLDHGRIVEAGRPESLLRAGTRYHDLFAPQLNLSGASA